MCGLDLGRVANRFNIVPVRTDDESCVIIGMVARAQAGRAIVFATGLQGCAVEGVDLLTIFGGEGQMKMGRRLLGLIDAQ